MSERFWMIRARGTMILFIIFLAGLVAGIFYRHHQPAAKRPYLMVAFLDVGAGDCTLIRTPHGHVILVDTGPADAEPQIVQALRQQRALPLDLLVLASPALASTGGLSALLRSGVVARQVWRCPGLAAEENADSVPVSAGSVFSEDGTTLTIIWPPRTVAPAAASALACRVDFGSEGFLLAAPLSPQQSQRLLADAGDRLNCDVLQAPDGGKGGGTTLELLRRVQPSVAIISCAGDTPPGALTMQRLDAASALVYRTDKNGAVTVYTDGITSPIIKDNGYHQ